MLTGTGERLLRVITPAAVAALFVVGLAVPASAAPEICSDPDVQLSPIEREEICSPPDNDDDDNTGGEWICEHKGVRVDCTAHGVWFGSPSDPHFVYDDGEVHSRPNSTNEWGCWRQPYGGSDSLPLPPGREPGDGGWYQLYCLFNAYTEDNPYVWPFLHWFDLVETPSPETIAMRLFAQIRLPAPDLATNPPTTGSVLVGMPVWLHTSDPATTWDQERISDEDCDWGFCVTIGGYADRIEWTMGDGNTVVCRAEQDIAWQPGMDFLNPGNACHHRYGRVSRGQPDGRYQATATIYYTTWWDSDLTGQSTIPDVTDFCGPAGDAPCQTTASILVEELHVLYGR